ncbi:MAG: hypothetical protein OEY94_10200 [Alphaproteobacteria bacterium]|nr:hypothetical protein [Alphaproteobacteria bacterium]
MSINSIAYNEQYESEIILIEHQEHVEDKLITLCENLERTGVKDIEIASGLIFTLHYILCKKENPKEARQYYKFLLKQCRQNIEAIEEFFILPE